MHGLAYATSWVDNRHVPALRLLIDAITADLDTSIAMWHALHARIAHKGVRR